MKRQSLKLTVLLLGGLLASSTGCAVFGIPSYRSDACLPVAPCATSGNVYADDLGSGFTTEATVGEQYCGSGTAVLPPLPGWLAAWKEKRDLPDPPTYPRFQPIPTRPMFK